MAQSRNLVPISLKNPVISCLATYKIHLSCTKGSLPFIRIYPISDYPISDLSCSKIWSICIIPSQIRIVLTLLPALKRLLVPCSPSSSYYSLFTPWQLLPGDQAHIMASILIEIGCVVLHRSKGCHKLCADILYETFWRLRTFPDKMACSRDCATFKKFQISTLHAIYVIHHRDDAQLQFETFKVLNIGDVCKRIV